MIPYHIQRFKFIDFMVIELRFFEEEEEEDAENMDEMWKSIFCILVVFTHSSP